MHETFVAHALIDQVLIVAGQNRLTLVEEIEVALGEAQQLEWDTFEVAFATAASGTIAAQANLRLENVPITARCRACDCFFIPGYNLYTCPSCHRSNTDIVAGNDVILKTVNGQTQE